MTHRLFRIWMPLVVVVDTILNLNDSVAVDNNNTRNSIARGLHNLQNRRNVGR